MSEKEKQTDKQKKEMPEERPLTPEEARKFLQKLRNIEIKQALLGNFIKRNDGKYVAGASDLFATNGLGDGAMEVLFWGISKRRYVYKTTFNNRQAIFKMSKLFQQFGKAFVLESVPEAVGCYVKSYIFRPVVLVFEEDHDKRLILTAYCGRAVFAFISIRRAVSRLNKLLPKQIFPNPKEPEKPKN